MDRIATKKIYFLILTMFFLLMTSCTPSGGGSRRGSSSFFATVTPTPEEEPTINPSGEEQSVASVNGIDFPSSFTLDSNFNSSFLIRGEIHDFIISGNGQFLSAIQCLAIPFSITSGTTGSDNVLVLAALPELTDPLGTRRYVYFIQPNNSETNLDHCGNTSLALNVQSQFPGSQIHYALANVCPTCTFTPSSAGFRLLFQSGLQIQDENASLSNLSLRIQDSFNPDPGPDPGTGVPNSCQTQADCTAIGFQCCTNEFQCADHGGFRPGINAVSYTHLTLPTTPYV